MLPCGRDHELHPMVLATWPGLAFVSSPINSKACLVGGFKLVETESYYSQSLYHPS